MKKLTGLILFILCATLLLSACGGKGGVSDFDYDFTETDAVREYTFYAHNWNTYEGQNNDRIIQAIEEKFNVKIKITGAPWDGWKERLSTSMAANEAPDLFFYLPNEGAYTEFVRKQQIQPLDGYIEKAEATYLKKTLESNQLKNATFGGLHYFMPNIFAPTNHTIFVRKDWMAKWMTARGYTNKAQPETLAEFEDMLKFFTESDPDANGKNDTVGFVASSDVEWFNNFLASFGVSPTWSEENGEYVLTATTEGYKTMLEWLGGLYNKGYIQDEFYTLKDADKEEAFVSGRAGAMLSNNNAMFDNIMSRMQASIAKGKDVNDFVDCMMPPSSNDGTLQGAFCGFDGYWGGFNISGTAKEPMRLVRILDYMCSPEGQMLRMYGVPDVHYTLDDEGVVVPNFAERKKEGVGRFMTSDPETANPNGKYSIGVYFSENKFDVDANNDLFITRDTSSSKYRAIVDKANTFIDGKELNYIQPRYYLDFDFKHYQNMKKITDDTNIFFIMVVSGQQSYATAYSEFQSRLNVNKYSEVKANINAINK